MDKFDIGYPQLRLTSFLGTKEADLAEKYKFQAILREPRNGPLFKKLLLIEFGRIREGT